MKQNKGAFYLALAAVLISAVAITLYFRERHKTGFILITDVYNGFEMKKEMEAKYNKARDARKKILDSLHIDLSVLSNQLKGNNTHEKTEIELFERKRTEYEQKMQMFDEDNTLLSRQYDEQIIKQLNQYVSDFGKENHYDLIFGNTTDGSIMYGTDKLNITREVTDFVNQRYKGIK